MKFRNLFVSAAIVTLTVGSLTGCGVLNGLLGNGTEVRDDSGAVIESGDANVFAIAVGDCFTDEVASDQVESLPVVPCSEPHENEVYFNHSMTGDAYPGDRRSLQKQTPSVAKNSTSSLGFPTKNPSWTTAQSCQHGTPGRIRAMSL